MLVSYSHHIYLCSSSHRRCLLSALYPISPTLPQATLPSTYRQTQCPLSPPPPRSEWTSHSFPVSCLCSRAAPRHTEKLAIWTRTALKIGRILQSSVPLPALRVTFRGYWVYLVVGIDCISIGCGLVETCQLMLHSLVSWFCWWSREWVTCKSIWRPSIINETVILNAVA